MPLSFMNDSVTVIRPGSKQERGATVPDWSVSSTTTDGAHEHVLANVQLTPEQTYQDRDGRVANATDRLRLRARHDANIQRGDRVVWNGATYEVDGDVFRVKSPTGRVSSTRCTLVLWRG